jgi:hypothetical protein
MTDRGQGTREPQTFHGHPLGGNDAPREADLVPGDRLVERFESGSGMVGRGHRVRPAARKLDRTEVR